MIAVILGLFVLWMSPAASAAPRFDVYFLAVGSSTYVVPSSPTLHGFTRIPGAAKSAHLVGDRLLAGGARYGVVLTSPPDAFISLKNVDAALDRVARQISGDRPSTPLLVFYFAGHGMAEGVGWNHFSIPGDLVYTGDPARLDVEALTNYTLHAATLADRLDKLHIPYLVILDSCSEGEPARFDSPVLTAQASRSLSAVADVLRAINEFRQESPVIFSTAPGTVVQVVQDPTDPEGTLIAPLARRLLLLLDRSTRSGRAASLGDVVRGLVSASLDPMTKPAVSHATPCPSWDGVLFQPGDAGGRSEEIAGDAKTASVCCGKKP